MGHFDWEKNVSFLFAFTWWLTMLLEIIFFSFLQLPQIVTEMFFKTSLWLLDTVFLFD